MPEYTTGEIAKLCGVSVRTVQYYDSRNILSPSRLSEGGRRLYSQEDLNRLKTICFLRDAGISINSISQLLSEEDPGSVIEPLLLQQEQQLREELRERSEKLALIEDIRRELKSIEHFSVASIGDIAYTLENKKKMRRLHILLLVTGLPLDILQWAAILLWIFTGVWWPFLVWLLSSGVYCLWMGSYYFRRVAYICPRCHTVFSPGVKEALLANHTTTLRKLTCTHCGHHGFCVETYGKEEKANG